MTDVRLTVANQLSLARNWAPGEVKEKRTGKLQSETQIPKAPKNLRFLQPRSVSRCLSKIQ
jgi:hypothetical protein